MTNLTFSEEELWNIGYALKTEIEQHRQHLLLLKKEDLDDTATYRFLERQTESLNSIMHRIEGAINAA